MLRHKLIDRVCCVIVALTLMLSVAFVGAAAAGKIAEDTTIGYETRLFDQSRVHTIDIIMDDWESFLQTCTSEVYTSCQIVIDGEAYKNVGIRGKGNTSLSSVAAYGNNRYSFKVEFDQYQNGLTYHGLDKLSLNNLIQDNTYMKDYFAYTLMNKMGVASPLCSFVQIQVNGEPWGLYLAVEGVEDSFLQRNYGKKHGELYKPDSMSFGGGRGNGRDFDMNETTEQFGFSFGDNENENGFFFSMPEGMPVPEEFDFSSWSGVNGQKNDAAAGVTPVSTSTPEPSAAPSGGNGISGNGSMPQMPGGGMPDMGSMPQMPGGGMPDMGSMPQMPGGGMPETGSMPQMPGRGMPNMGNLPSGFAFPDQDRSAVPQSSTETPVPAATPAPSGQNENRKSNGLQRDEAASPRNRDSGRQDMKFGGGFGMGSTDVKLQYSDDDPASYSNIFNNAKTDINATDQARLIASIKALNEGNVSVVDTDAVIRYMAVHNFLCNDDSYTGMMVHNYYLYEEDGVMSMIPWDYNLAFGGFSGGGSNGTSSVNTSISRLVSMGNDSDRPMAGWITANEEYMAQYLQIYQQFITDIFDSGWFANEIDRVIAMIDPYVQKDPTAFCTYDEFKEASRILKSFCLKRAESVTRQLNGDNTKVDASDLNLSLMGTMSGMGGGFEPPNAGGAQIPEGKWGGSRPFDAAASLGQPQNNWAAMPDEGGWTAMPAGNGAESNRSGGSVYTLGNRSNATAIEASSADEKTENKESDASSDGMKQPVSQDRFRSSFDGGFPFAATNSSANTRSAWMWMALSCILLLAALIGLGCYKNKR